MMNPKTTAYAAMMQMIVSAPISGYHDHQNAEQQWIARPPMISQISLEMCLRS